MPLTPYALRLSSRRIAVRALAPVPCNATEALIAEALARGVRIRSAERFQRMPPDHVTLVLNYAGVSGASLKRAGTRLAEAYVAVTKRGIISPPETSGRSELTR